MNVLTDDNIEILKKKYYRNDKMWKTLFNDFKQGNPDKSGNYVVFIKGKNKIGIDDYTTSNGGHWWNYPNDESILYSPSSFRGLGSY